MRYEVRLVLSGGRHSTYAVTTWHDEERAVEMAKRRHAKLRPEDVVADFTKENAGMAKARNSDRLVSSLAA